MSSSRFGRIWTVLPLALALGGLGGCVTEAGSTKTGDGVEETAQAVTQQNQAVQGQGAEAMHGRPPFPGGPDFLVMAALHELDLTAAQRTTLEDALHKAAPGPRARGPMPAPFAAIAAGVRAGKIDEAAVLAKAGEPDAAAAEHQAAVAGAIQTLHDTLTKEQRRALADAVEKHLDEHGPPGGPGGPGGRGHGPGAFPGDSGPLGHLLRDLNLTDAQRTSIDQALAADRPAAPDEAAMKKQMETMHTELRARIEAFTADTIDPKALSTPPAGAEAHGPKEHLGRMVKSLAVIVPLLEPAQREKLASILEKGPMGPPGEPPPGR